MSAGAAILEARDIVVLLGGQKRWLRPTVLPVRAQRVCWTGNSSSRLKALRSASTLSADS